jgi:hypothetical protein
VTSSDILSIADPEGCSMASTGMGETVFLETRLMFQQVGPEARPAARSNVALLPHALGVWLPMPLPPN